MKKYVFISISILIVLLTVGVMKIKSRTTPAPAPIATDSLQGSAAVQQLKADGSYSSLAEAYQVARYAISKVDSTPLGQPAPYAQNPKQNFNSYFTRKGLQLYAGSSRVNLSLVAAGYDDQLTEVSSGEVQIQNNRVEIAHSESIKQWFINKADGLEHGFTLATPLSDSDNPETLRLKLAVKSNLSAQVVGDGQSLSWRDNKGEEVLKYAGLKAWDAKGKSLAARMKAQAGDLMFEVDVRDANYPVTIDPTFTAHNKLFRPDEEADSFGSAVATNGSRVVVGAPQTDSGALNATGAAYIFTKEGALWVFRQKLTPASANANDRFGSSLAISNATIVVGVPGHDASSVLNNTGKAQVYVFSNGEWVSQQALTQSSPQAGEGFGSSVAIDVDTAVVGSPFFNSQRGRVSVFTRSSNVWSFRENLSFTPQIGDEFGTSVAVSGTTIAAGIPLRDTAFTNAGTVRLFMFNGTTWPFFQDLQATDSSPMDEFGTSVSIQGNRLIVGAIFDSSTGVSGHGSAYYFTRPAVGQFWAFQRKFMPTVLSANHNYGASVAISGSTIVIGTLGAQAAYIYDEFAGVWLEKNLNRPSGNFGWSVAIGGGVVVVGDPDNPVDGDAAAVYESTGFSWTERGLLFPSNSASNGLFGTSIAIEGNTAVVGSPGQSNGSASSGVVYVFTKERSGYWNYRQALRVNAGSSSPYFGGAVGISNNTIAVGSPEPSRGVIILGTNTPSAVGDGQVYLFAQVAGQWQLVQTLSNSSRGEFGAALSIAGGYLAVGAPQDTVGPNNLQGAVYVYRSTDTGWIFVQRLTASDGLAGDFFGVSVVTDGNTLAIGASEHETSLSTLNQGAVYVYTRSGTSFNSQQKLLAADGLTGDRFGRAVGLSGNTLAIGAPQVNVGTASDQGAVYVFTRTGSTWFQQGSRLVRSTGAANDFWGSSVTIEGDVLVAGSFGNGSALRTVPCYAAVFSRVNGVWTEDPVLVSPNANNNNRFGQTVVLKGNTLMVGAPTDNAGLLVGAGSIYTYTAPIISCAFSINPTSQSFTVTGGTGSVNVTATAGCSWTAISNASWITLSSFGGTGNGSVGYIVASNPGSPRTGTVTVAGQTFTVTQGAFSCTYSLTPTSANFSANAASGTVAINTQTGCNWTAVSNAAWISITGTASGTGSGSFGYNVTNNPGSARVGTITAGGQTFTVNQSGVGATNLQFYPLARPVRLLDTRAGQSGCDAPGAMIAGGTSRTQTAAGRTCSGLTIPANAKALVGNITTVESGGGHLTLYPSDAAQPLVANSNFGPNEILNNVFTVGLGADGAFKIFVTSSTNVVVDITGYYAPPLAGGLYFHPLPRPIRVLETRQGQPGCTTTGVPIQGGFDQAQLATISCNGVTIPSSARAIVGNATSLNSGAGFLTLYPQGASRPFVASSNFTAGQIMNAPFTVALGAMGEFMIFSTINTDLVVDVMGYYSDQLNDANGVGLLFNPLPAPVRLLETRAGQSGCYTPGAPLAAGSTRQQQARGACGGQTIAATAQAIVGNATVVFPSAVGYLTFWPNGATQPLVATTNFTSGQVFNRHFTVGLGATGLFNIFAAAQTDLVIDVSGYFAP